MSLLPYDLRVASNTVCTLEIRDIMANGRLTPRLILSIKLATPTESIRVKLHHIIVRILCNLEIVGEGLILSEEVSSNGTDTQIEVQTSRQMLKYVTETIGQSSTVSLKFAYYGFMQVMKESSNSENIMNGNPSNGYWKEYLIPNNGITYPLFIARSDWYSKVLQPIGNDDFLYLEVAVPKGELADLWRNALSHLSDAEKCFAMGDDAGVFSKLKGMTEALPGAKKNIVDDLPSPKKEEVNKLLKSYSEFLNHGRHVAIDGENAGQFPVNRIDSENAIAFGKIMISYISRLLSSI